MKNLFWIQKNPYSHKENLQLNQETEAIKEELLDFKAKGGGALVENTTTGLSRDVRTLKWLAEETGVHIIAGAGFYVDATHSSETRAKSVEQVSIKAFISWTIVVVVLSVGRFTIRAIGFSCTDCTLHNFNSHTACDVNGAS